MINSQMNFSASFKSFDNLLLTWGQIKDFSSLVLALIWILKVIFFKGDFMTSKDSPEILVCECYVYSFYFHSVLNFNKLKATGYRNLIKKNLVRVNETNKQSKKKNDFDIQN